MYLNCLSLWWEKQDGFEAIWTVWWMRRLKWRESGSVVQHNIGSNEYSEAEGRLENLLYRHLSMSFGGVLWISMTICIFFSSVSLALSVSSGCSSKPAVVFVFGDSNSDTGGLVSGLGFPVNLPNGRTFFHRSTGRLSDGRLVIDFLCKYFNFFYLFTSKSFLLAKISLLSGYIHTLTI